MAMRKITSKRAKTEADYAELAKIEWAASLYLADLGSGLQVVIPGANIEGMITEAGKKRRLGKVVKAGVLCYDDFALDYDGPQDIQELWPDEQWRLVSMPPIRGNRVVRTRPKFFPWSVEIQVFFDPGIISRDVLQQLIDYAGRYCGLCDWRPRYGTFVAQDWSNLPAIPLEQGLDA
jgi:hypothetical protein